MLTSGFPTLFANGTRRVVTGIDAHGKAIVMTDAILTGDPRARLIWACDAPPVMGDATPPCTAEWWPPAGGVRVTLSSRKPDRELAPPPAGQRAWPDINDVAGFHASCSADIVIMISGTIWLELDDGIEVVLNAGDTLVQNGTRHKWHNHGDDWPVMAVVIVGARPMIQPSGQDA